MILYKIDTKGKMRSLEIKAENGILYQISGLIDGTKVTHDKECKPKNIGKSNATTSETQAVLEAEALIEKKIKEGYSKDINNLSEVLLPMKIHKYQDHANKIKPDAYYSPKLNGINGEFRLLSDDKLVLLSRGGEELPMLKHLEQPVKDYLKQINETSINVELYKHGWYLEDITAAAKKYKPDTHEFPSKELEAHIFDIPSNTGIYEDRLNILKNSIPTHPKLFVIPTYQYVDIEKFLQLCLKKGYEGIVIHNPKGLYKYNTRSLDVIKYKIALDGEYKIAGYELDNQNNPTLICEIGSDTFKVRPKGTDNDRKTILKNIDKYIGSWYKIEYETLSKYGIPLKPIGIGLRDCDINGNPLI